MAEAAFDGLAPALRDLVAGAPGWAKHLNGADLDVANRDALARLPVLRKPDLMAMQEADPPFGGLLPKGANPPRLFISPGPVREVQPMGGEGGSDPYGGRAALHAAGFRAGDALVNCFGYHGTPGGFILDTGAAALGCPVFPAGPGNTEQTVAALAALRPRGYVGTPDFLAVLLDRAGEEGADLSSIAIALVSGGALFPAMREDYAARGVAVMQAYATADAGVIAYETRTDEGLDPGMVVHDRLIAEIVAPGTGDPVAEGEVGELVVTLMDANWPLVRFGTGDLTKWIAPDRIAGWMGRADQRTKVKGMFVDPAQIARVAKAFPAIERARLVVAREGGSDAMALRVVGSGIDTDAVAERLRAETGLRGTVETVDTLPADGVVVEDARDYDA